MLAECAGERTSRTMEKDREGWAIFRDGQPHMEPYTALGGRVPKIIGGRPRWLWTPDEATAIKLAGRAEDALKLAADGRAAEVAKRVENAKAKRAGKGVK